MLFCLFILFTFLVGLGINFMNYLTRGKVKSKNGVPNGDKDLFAQNKKMARENENLKIENKELTEQLLESDNCYDVPVNATPVNPTPADDSNKLCVVCLLEPADHVLLPCGHVCVCKACAALLMECPICRANISERKHVYFSKEVRKNQFVIKL